MGARRIPAPSFALLQVSLTCPKFSSFSPTPSRFLSGKDGPELRFSIAVPPRPVILNEVLRHPAQGRDGITILGSVEKHGDVVLGDRV